MSNTIGSFRSVYQVKSTNAQNGSHFFSPCNMKAFSSRVHDALYGGCVFVTSERNTWSNNPRAFTIRVAMADGGIQTYGGFGDYCTRHEAHKEAQFVGQALLDGRMIYNTSTFEFEMVKP